PFTIGQQTLVFNGEIYNFRELRSELSKLRPDYQWRTTGDTEVLLMSYQVWAEKCVEHLNGMFAFVVWDEREKTLFLARDRMGQKPQYIAHTESEEPGRPVCAFAFASELRPLLLLAWSDKEQPEGRLINYLRYGSTDAMEWGIYEGGPGICCTVRGPTSEVSSNYFDPNTPLPANAG